MDKWNQNRFSGGSQSSRGSSGSTWGRFQSPPRSDTSSPPHSVDKERVFSLAHLYASEQDLSKLTELLKNSWDQAGSFDNELLTLFNSIEMKDATLFHTAAHGASRSLSEGSDRIKWELFRYLLNMGVSWETKDHLGRNTYDIFDQQLDQSIAGDFLREVVNYATN